MSKVLPVLAAILIIFAACTNTSSSEMMEVSFTVEGMFCEGCVNVVTNEMIRIPGVETVHVTLPDSTVKYTARVGRMPDKEQIRTTLGTHGYIVHFNQESLQ